MSARRDESTRARIIDAANVLFASAVPNFATSTSYFDIVATTDHHGIRARLLQWHRVGDTSLRCLLALVGPAKPSYREAVDALAEQLEQQATQTVQQQQPTALAPIPGKAHTRHPIQKRIKITLTPEF